MEDVKLRCHFSMIFESLWQFWAAIVIILINQIDDVIALIRSAIKDGLQDALSSGGIWVIGGLALVTLAVFMFQFFRWKNTWITLEDNLVIIERNTLKKYRNTIAVENISSVNTQRNLFERLAGTYRIKLDTNSMTTASKADVSIVFREDIAMDFRRQLIERINLSKGKNAAETVSEESCGDVQHEDCPAGEDEKKVFRASKKDMAGFAFYSMSVWSLAIVVAAACFSGWFIGNYGMGRFLAEAAGSFIAVAIMVAGAVFDIVGKFLAYYGFTVYRDGRDLHVKRGLIRLQSYTIPTDKITALKIEQKPFSRLFGKYCANVVTVGVGDEEGESSNITMAVSKDELKKQLGELLPEYGWADVDMVIPEEKGSAAVRLFKSVKWHILTLSAVLVMILMTDLSLWIAVGIPVFADLYISLLYLLSHIAAGYYTAREGMILSQGYFTRSYMICTYERVQIMTMNYHPAAKRRGTVYGQVSLLNSAAVIPFIRRDTAIEISEKITGGTK